MENPGQLWRRLLFFLKGERFDRELEEEMRFHIDMKVERNIAAGMSPEEARFDAVRSFGNRTKLHEESREVWLFSHLERLAQDLRYGLRVLGRNPAFSLVAVLALALGIGANTAIFSVVNSVLLRPLPFPDPNSLVILRAVNVKAGDGSTLGASPADFFDWRAQSGAFEALGAETGGGVTLTGTDAPELIPGARFSEGLLEMLGARPFMGRPFSREEFKSSGEAVVLLSYRAWRGRFGGDPEIVGKSFNLSGRATTVIGVMPADFKHPNYAEVWTPMPEDSGEMRIRSSRYVSVIGRLAEGVPIEQAQTEMETIAARLSEQHPESNADWSVRLVPLKEQIVGKIRPALLILLGAVGFVLLVACANVANMLLARSAARQKEIALRSALGASRSRVVRQLLTESLLLSSVGAALGLLAAYWGVDAIIALIPESMNFPRLDEIRIDTHVLGFTVAISFLTGVGFGLIPALQASKQDLQGSLKESGTRSSGDRGLQRARAMLIVSEIALTLLLLTGAGLLVKSFARLQNTDPGFRQENLLTMSIGASMKKYGNDGDRASYYTRIMERVAALPEVESAALSSGAPMTGFNLLFSFTIEGRPANPDDVPQGIYASISPNYFRTLGIPLLSGREFDERDAAGSPPAAIINETMARQFFSGEDPLGKRIRINYLGRPTSLEIVGVVRDTRQEALAQKTGIEIYSCYRQAPWFSTALIVRAKAAPASATLSVRRAIQSIDSDQAITSVKTMDELISESVAQPRLYTWLLSVFAAIALTLAAVGIYGVMSYTVAQRTHEIGIRMALGAQVGDILKMIVSQSLSLVFAGVGLGLIGAVALTRIMSALLYDVSATDPATFAAIALLLSAVALLASLIPARRATKVDPLTALRYE
ncbi:MAG TPA: ABC transporter permease [Blastocatellia bacterium]|jgi:putative ABC transport system permease protein|nr:ABC transporter permease [Blastocatellia bacterium]